MIKQLSLVSAAALALSVFGTGAWADGEPAAAYAPAAERSCSSGPFAGPYIGAAIGGGKHDSEIHDRNPGSPTFGQSFDDDDSALTFGGYAGYNWQCGRWVFGVETDFNYFDASSTARVDTVSLKSEIDWYGTLRARAGVVLGDSTLLYATGGLAYSKIDHTFSDSLGPAGPFSQSDDDSAAGWTIGGGIERLHHSRWLLRAEAFYVDLGDETHTYVVDSTACGGGPCTAISKWEDDFWVARIGLTYKFGVREEVVPLK
ncbi:MAG: porin family protein [Hyphomicrobium sp.]|nr:porin family protein [Hyphomicrobium sp.]